ncbi:hypothetical protein CLAIMM_10602 [Cladophialophora immunda]|nr:hypothetical protein CLAIMM_10602 [Cladophialophora immunda]
MDTTRGDELQWECFHVWVCGLTSKERIRIMLKWARDIEARNSSCCIMLKPKSFLVCKQLPCVPMVDAFCSFRPPQH